MSQDPIFLKILNITNGYLFHHQKAALFLWRTSSVFRTTSCIPVPGLQFRQKKLSLGMTYRRLFYLYLTSELFVIFFCLLMNKEMLACHNLITLFFLFLVNSLLENLSIACKLKIYQPRTKVTSLLKRVPVDMPRRSKPRKWLGMVFKFSLDSNDFIFEE